MAKPEVEDGEAHAMRRDAPKLPACKCTIHSASPFLLCVVEGIAPVEQKYPDGVPESFLALLMRTNFSFDSSETGESVQAYFQPPSTNLQT